MSNNQEEYSPNKIYHHQATLEALRAGRQTVPKHLHLIVSDLCNEDCNFCFVGETPITTFKKGKVRTKNIENISVGDSVISHLGNVNKVVEVSVREVLEIYEVTFSDGRKLALTGNHPVLTKRGFINAQDLHIGDTSFVQMRMPAARKENPQQMEHLSKKSSMSRSSNECRKQEEGKYSDDSLQPYVSRRVFKKECGFPKGQQLSLRSWVKENSGCCQKEDAVPSESYEESENTSTYNYENSISNRNVKSRETVSLLLSNIQVTDNFYRSWGSLVKKDQSRFSDYRSKKSNRTNYGGSFYKQAYFQNSFKLCSTQNSSLQETRMGLLSSVLTYPADTSFRSNYDSSQVLPVQRILEWDLGEVKVTKVQVKKSTVKVYNFTCTPDHTYMANGIAVHNCAYRMSGYPSNELFKVLNNDGTVNNNPNRMLTKEQVLNVLSDAAYLGFKAIQFSVDGKERLPLINPKGEFVVLSIEDFVNQFFANPCKDYETSKVGGWSSYAIKDDGSLVLDEITDVYRHPSQEDLARITLEDGRSALVTQSHSLNVIRNGEIKKIAVKDIRVLSDKIACVNWSTPLGKKAPNVFSFSEIDQDYLEMPPAIKECEGNPVNSRVYLSPEFFRLLGYFVAEGSALTSGLVFCFGSGPRENTYRSDVVSICENVFGLTPKIRGLKVQVDSIRVKRLFSDLGLLVPQANRNIPDIVWSSSDLAKKNFLAGLFAGDGNYRSNLDSRGHNRNSLHLKTCNPTLAQEVLTLLSQLSVKATCSKGINKKRKIEGRNLEESPYYSVNIYGGNNLQKVPQILSLLNAKPLYKSSKYSNVGSRSSYETFGVSSLALRIKSIEVVKNDNRPVYDITVKDTHRFISTSGIGFFNTGGGESTVHPNFQEFIDTCNRLGLEYALVSNGVLLHKFSLEKAAWVRISIDASNSKTYSSMRRVSEKVFDRVLANVKDAVSKKDANTVFGLGFVVTKDNYLEIEDFCNLAKDLGVDNVRLSALFQNDDADYFKDIFEAIKEQSFRIKKLSSPTFKIFNNFNDRLSDLALQHPDYSYCGYQHFTTYLGADSNLYRCCVTSYNPLGLLGSIKDKSFKDLIQGLDWDKNFDAHDCPRCMFNNKNKEILYALKTNPKHVNFV